MLQLERQSHQEGKSVQLILSDSHTNLQNEMLCAKLNLLFLKSIIERNLDLAV